MAPYIIFLLFTIQFVPSPSMSIEDALALLKVECESAAKTARAGGNFVRQCIKDSRLAARENHASVLLSVLEGELKSHQERKTKEASPGVTISEKPSRPHILLITSDQQRRDSIGIYARRGSRSSSVSTPHLDRLAAEGCMVWDAYAAAPVCAPSRTSVLLGVHVPVHGVFENGLGSYNPQVLTPFVDVLAGDAARPSTSSRGGNSRRESDVANSFGYATALIGKAGFSPLPTSFTHLNTLGEGANEARAPGTDRHNYLETYLVNCSMAWVLERHRLEPSRPWFLHLSFSSPHPPNTVPAGWPLRYNDTRHHAPAATATDSLHASTAARATGLQDVDIGDWRGGGGAVGLPGLDFVEGDLEALPWQTQVLQGMREPPAVTDSAPSTPLAAAPATAAAATTAAEDGAPSHGVRGSSSVDGLPPRHEWVAASRAFPPELGGRTPDLGTIAAMRTNYYNQAAFVDDQIGRMLHFLDYEMEFGGNLLVIFTSDHGALLHDHGVPDKHSLLGEAPRVPLLLRWPGVIPRSSSLPMASLVDVAPTIVAAAATAAAAAAAGPPQEGPSADPLLLKDHEKARAFLEHQASGFDLVSQIRQWHARNQRAAGNDGEAAGGRAAAAPVAARKPKANVAVRSAVAVTDFFGCGVFTEEWKLLYYPAAPSPTAVARPSDGRASSAAAERSWARVGGQAFLFHRKSDPGDRYNRFTTKKRVEVPESSNAEEDSRDDSNDDAHVSQVMLAALLRWRARQRRQSVATPPSLLDSNGHGSRAEREGGARAQRAKAILSSLRGNDADADLSRDLEALPDV